MSEWIHAGSVTEIEDEGARTIPGGIVVFKHEGELYAIENRCPHMGFPLHMGTLCNGIVTCHWHHARFDVCSGGTLDPWADDVPAHSVRIAEGQVYVDPNPKNRKTIGTHFRRLREGLEQNIALIIAKSVIGLVEAGVAESDIAKVGVEFGTTQRAAGWGPGLTILTAMVNVLPTLDPYGRILALVHGLVHVARDCANRAPKRSLQPLPDTEFAMTRLASWYRQCVEVRDTDGAERVLLAALQRGAGKRTVADMMLVAATDHFYLDGGHTFDFHNKAFELLEHVGDAESERVLTSLVPILSNPMRSEEQQNWLSPVNLVRPLWDAFTALDDGSVPERMTMDPFDDAAFVQQILSDDPLETVAAITRSLQQGLAPARLAQLVALAAATRVMRFHVQNDFADWIAVLHTFTNAHAIHVRLSQCADPLVIRAIYHTAMRIYLDRFLNIPQAPLPTANRAQQADYTTDLNAFLNLLDGRQQVAQAANWVSLYLQQSGDMPSLFNTLGHALLREDAEFHSFQMYEAALQEYAAWRNSTSAIAKQAQETLVFALTRYLAAHAPTARELSHIARIAWRLQKGERLYEEE